MKLNWTLHTSSWRSRLWQDWAPRLASTGLGKRRDYSGPTRATSSPRESTGTLGTGSSRCRSGRRSCSAAWGTGSWRFRGAPISPWAPRFWAAARATSLRCSTGAAVSGSWFSCTLCSAPCDREVKDEKKKGQREWNVACAARYQYWDLW